MIGLRPYESDNEPRKLGVMAWKTRYEVSERVMSCSDRLNAVDIAGIAGTKTLDESGETASVRQLTRPYMDVGESQHADLQIAAIPTRADMAHFMPVEKTEYGRSSIVIGAVPDASP